MSQSISESASQNPPFVGRTSLLTTILEEITAGRVVVLTGAPGIGKTAIAERVYARLIENGRFPSGHLWLDVELHPRLEKCLHEMATAFFGNRQQVEPLDRLRARVLDHMRTHAVLIAFDNFESATDPELRQLLVDIRSPAGAIVATREYTPVPNGPVVEPVPGLPPRDAAHLFADLARDAGAKDVTPQTVDVESLCQEIEYHPLAIQLLAPQAAFTTISTLLEGVKRSIKIIETKHQVPGQPARHQSVRACYRYSFNRLSKTAKRLLLALSPLPKGTGSDLLEAIEGSLRANDARRKLIFASLLRRTDSRYTFHPLVRQVALEQARSMKSNPEISTLKLVLALAIQKGGSTDPACPGDARRKALQWMEDEWENLTSCWKRADELGYYDAVCGLSDVIRDFSYHRRHLHDCARIHERAEELRRCHSSSISLAQTLINRALIAQEKQEWESVILLNEEARDITQRHDNKLLLGKALYQLSAGYYYGRKSVDEAIKAAKQSIMLLSHDEIQQNIARGYLGVMYMAQYQWKEAEQLFQLRLRSDQKMNDVAGERDVRANLATIFFVQGKWDDCKRMCEQAIDLCESHGMLVQKWRTALQLCDLYTEVGFWGDALRLCQDMVGVLEGNAEYEIETGLAYGRLGYVRSLLNQIDEAIRAYGRCLTILERHDRSLYAGARQGAGAAYAKRGDLVQGREACEEARREFGSRSDRWREARACIEVSAILTMEGEPEKAVELARKAAGSLQNCGDPLGEARAVEQLATALCKQGNWQDGESTYKDSREKFHKLGVRFREGRVALQLAHSQEDRGAYQQALENARQASAILSETEDQLSLNEAEQVVSRLKERTQHVESGSDRSADVVVITALSREREAVLRHLGKGEKVTGALNRARTYEEWHLKNGIVVAHALALGMGQIEAAMVARDAIAEWQPRAVILVGICAGPRNKVELGDVVLSELVVDYELAKVTADEIVPRYNPYRANVLLWDRLLHFDDASWERQIVLGRPDGKQNIVPAVQRGIVLCGNKVIANRTAFEKLIEDWPQTRGLEMESAGVVAAVYTLASGPGFVIDFIKI